MASAERKKKVKKENRQLMWTLAVIITCFVVFAGTYAYVKGLNTFEYAGLDWTRQKSANLELYAARTVIPTTNITYNIYLRTDPRENEIPTNVRFYFDNKVYISMNPDVSAICDRGDMQIAATTVAFFFQAIGKPIAAASTDKNTSKLLNVTFANCENIPKNSTVVMYNNSAEPRITKLGECYTINVGDCEGIKASEKFVLAAMAQAAGAKIN